MPITQGDYEVPEGEEEQIDAAAKHDVKIDKFATRNEFHSDQITIKGKVYGRNDRDDWGSIAKMKRETTAIPGLRCPDCHAQAFKTDHKRVAVCGDYPGWYFFYVFTAMNIKPKSKIVLKANGDMVEETGAEKGEGEF